MAALTRPANVFARGVSPGDGTAIVALWRELWDAHERWGGYPGSHDARAYERLAVRLEDDARARAGRPILGRHAHFVADLGGAPCGQVEGWFEQNGIDGSTALTCEVRSLIVGERVRRIGAGRALLEGLAAAARVMARGAPCVLAAEVLEPNPAHAFYARLGFAPIAWAVRIDATAGAKLPRGSFTARVAGARDALAVSRLEGELAARRCKVGDLRFDRPRTIDATLLGALATHLAGGAAASACDPITVVVLDDSGVVRGAASLAVQTLEPPFLPVRRALLGRFALDPTCPALPLVTPLVALGCRQAAARGAHQVELIDLSAPGTELHDAGLAIGARAWSRVVTRTA